MGNSVANPGSSSDGHAVVVGAGPPPSSAVGDSGAKPPIGPSSASSDGGSASAADAAPVITSSESPNLAGSETGDTVGDYGANPPIAPSPSCSDGGSTSPGAAPPACSRPAPGAAPLTPSKPPNLAGSETGGAAPPARSVNLPVNSKIGETKNPPSPPPPPEYPRRPGVADCSYYVKFGICRYGIKCWFNHPPAPPTHSNSTTGSSQAASTSSSHHHSRQNKQQQQQQQYSPGKACNSNRPERKMKAEQVKTNFIGLPLRPGAGLCSYYMKRGTCKFGTNCKFHHPDPKSENEKLHVVEESSKLNSSSEPTQRAQNEQSVSLVTSPSSATSETIPTQGDPTCTEQSADKVCVPLSIQRGNLSDRDEVLMAVKGILDSLTPEKFDIVKDQLIEAGITIDDILEDVITVMFEKAVSEPTVCPMYAQLCSYVNKKLPSSPPEEPNGKEIAFTSVLLNNCHEVFQGAGNLCAEIDRLASLDQEMETQNKQIMLMKLRTLGNIRLIGELLKQKIVTEKIEQHRVQMDENKQGKPDWDTFSTKVFCDICTAEVLAGNRPTDHLNAIGYNNLYAKFNEKTKKGYNHEQLKSKWESLKQDYQTWKTLMQSDDDLGQDHKMNTISASPEWWAKKMEAVPDCGKFRSAPLENVDLLNIMFEDMLDSSSTTPEANSAANSTIESEHGSGDGNDTSIIDKDANEQSKEAMLQISSNKEPNTTKPKTNCVRAELNHLVKLDENVSPGNPATSMWVDRAGSNISEIMELVVDAGVEEDSDEHFTATQLFIRPEYREMFLTLKTPRGRLGWLKKMCREKEQI